MARPGLLQNERADLEGLSRLGVDTLVSLEEEAFPAEKLAALGIRQEHLPIRENAAPPLSSVLPFLARTLARARAGRATVFHCKVGFGRTGTMLAACLVAQGKSAKAALSQLRAESRLPMPSPEQFSFLLRLQEHFQRPRAFVPGVPSIPAAES